MNTTLQTYYFTYWSPPAAKDRKHAVVLANTAEAEQFRLGLQLGGMQAVQYKLETRKRRIKRNVYGNINGYLGTRNVMDFGLSDFDALQWLAEGRWYSGYHRNEDGTHGAFCVPAADGSYKVTYTPVPADYKWVRPEGNV